MIIIDCCYHSCVRFCGMASTWDGQYLEGLKVFVGSFFAIVLLSCFLIPKRFKKHSPKITHEDFQLVIFPVASPKSQKHPKRNPPPGGWGGFLFGTVSLWRFSLVVADQRENCYLQPLLVYIDASMMLIQYKPILRVVDNQ